MAEVLVTSAAQRDYVEALKWYAERSSEAAESFDAALDSALGEIAQVPERFPRCSDSHRFYLLRRFPYQVIYRVAAERIEVIAFAHTSREPSYWSNR